MTQKGDTLRSVGRISPLEALSKLRAQRRVTNAATLGLVILGPILAVATFLALGPFDMTSSALALRLVLLTDIV